MPRVPEEVIQDVLQATDIVDLVSSYFPLKRAGKDYRANCPFHQEKTPSFYVIPNKQSYHCFGCGAGGSALRFVMQYENLDFPTALKKLADRAGVILPDDPVNDAESARRHQHRSRLLRVLAEATTFFQDQLHRSPEAAVARDYWKGRGLSSEHARNWQIGYAPGNLSPLATWAKSNGFSARNLIDAGLASLRKEDNPQEGIYARFRARLMFPIHNDYGDVIAFSGRILDPDAKTAKYVNSPETSLFTKGKTLFGLHRAKRPILKQGYALICEGQMDLIACVSAGFDHAIAPLGTSLTPEHARLLKRHTDKVVLCYDGDTAGAKAADRAFRELSHSGLAVEVAPMPENEDPDSFIRGCGADAFAAHIAASRPYFDFFFARRADSLRTGDLANRTEVAREAAAALAHVNDAILRETQLQQVALRLQLAPDLIRNEMRRAIQRLQAEAARPAALGGDRQDNAPPEVDTPHDPMRSLMVSLAALACNSPDARQQIANSPGSPWPDLPGSHLLRLVLDSPIKAGSESAVNAFLATLESRDEATLRASLRDLEQVDNRAAATEHLYALHQALSRQRRQEITARLRQPGLPLSEIESLTKELLDLQKPLANPSPRAAAAAPPASPEPDDEDPF